MFINSLASRNSLTYRRYKIYNCERGGEIMTDRELMTDVKGGL